MRLIRIASRKSDLARLQAYQVGRALKEAHKDLEIEYRFKESLGDINQHDPLWKMPERGIFTEDFVDDLVQGRADLVVHSWKDLPTQERPKTKIAATLKRADPRDLLLLKEGVFHEKPPRLRILSSSPRRAYTLPEFLRSYLPFRVESGEFLPVRGNIPTRMSKFLEREEDGLLVAKAALDRLLSAEEEEFRSARERIVKTLEASRFIVLPLEIHPTAAAQGALAVEISRERADLEQLLAFVQHWDDFAAVQRERAILASYGGGCHQKIGISVIETSEGRIEYLRGETDAGERLKRISWEPREPAPRFRKDEAWPAEKPELFVRTAMPCSAPDSHLFVAKAEALPGDWDCSSKLVWTSGLESWRKLAARGVFVCGSSESLGEEVPPLRELCLAKEKTLPRWTKLSHADALSAGIPLLPTYALQSSENAAEELRLMGRKRYFFWASASSFRLALGAYPELRCAQHACGLGHTLRELKKVLPEGHVRGFLSYNHWRESLL